MSEPPVYLRGKPQFVTVYKQNSNKRARKAPSYSLPSADYAAMLAHPQTPALYPSLVMPASPSKLSGSALATPSLIQLELTGVGKLEATANEKRGRHSEPTTPSEGAQLASGAKSSSGSGTKTNQGGERQAPDKQARHKSSSTTRPSSSSSERSPAESSAKLESRPLAINFTDYDDESGGYYLTRLPAGTMTSKKGVVKYLMLHRRLDSAQPAKRGERRKRQISYSSNYGQPCHGLPVQVNIKSRIKLNERIFPIFGRSQINKCVNLNKPLLPPLGDTPPQVY